MTSQSSKETQEAIRCFLSLPFFFFFFFSSFSMPARSPTHASHSNTGIFSCEVIHLQPYVFYPDKPIEVQITVNHIDTSDKSFVHDTAVSWVENTNYDRFTACVLAAGFNERESNANVTIDWMAYQ